MTNLANITQFSTLTNFRGLISLHQSDFYIIIGIALLFIIIGIALLISILLCVENSSVASSAYDAELPLTKRPRYLKVTEDEKDRRPIVDIETIKYRRGTNRLIVGLIQRGDTQGTGLLAIYRDRLSTEGTIRDNRSWEQRTIVFQGTQYQALILTHRAVPGSQLTVAPQTQAVQDAISNTFSDRNMGNGSWIARPFLGQGALVGTVHPQYRIYSAGSPVVLDQQNRKMFVRLASPQEVRD